jgi:RHS repeat-associated protein
MTMTPAPASSLLPCPSLGSQNNGNILEILDTHISSRSQAFSYDNLNRIASFINGDGSMQETYTIDRWGNLQQNGTLTYSPSYNLFNQIDDGSAGYDAAGNVTSFNNTIITAHYTYDAENRMVTANNGATTYTYSADGNRVRKDLGGGNWTEYINFNGQPMAERSPDGTWSDYIYANGQRIARADNYDIRIHLSGTNCSNCGNPNLFVGTTSLTAANGYTIRSGDVLTWRQYQDGSTTGGIFFGLIDGSGNFVNGNTLNDSDGQPIDQDTTMNSWHVRTVDLSSFAGLKVNVIAPFQWTSAPAGSWDIYYGDITLVSTDGSFIPIYNRSMMTLSLNTNPGVSNFQAVTEKASDTNPLTTTTYYHEDQIGSTSLLTAGTGWPVSSNTFYPFGQGPTSGLNHYLYTGKERDTESGNDYFGARYYSSSMGRFMSPDWSASPVALPYADLDNPQSLNLYAYAGNNPLVRIDKDGHCWSAIQSVCNFFVEFKNELRYNEWTTNTQLAQVRDNDRQRALALQMKNNPPQVSIQQVFWLGPTSTGLTAATEGTAAASEGKGLTVLGHYPEYVNLAESTGANYFNVPTSEWNAMTPSEQWSMNERFLDEAIARGDKFQLATPLDKVRPGSFFERELRYLESKGYIVNETGTTLVRVPVAEQ